MEIVNTDKWELEKITIRTFARCIVKKRIDESFFNALSSVGLTHMQDISRWFHLSYSFAGHPICSLVSLLVNKEEYALWQNGEIDIRVPAKIFKTRKIGPVRAELIAEIIQEGFKNIINDTRRELYILRAIRLSEEWQLNSVAHMKKGSFNEVVSDGSKLQSAAFAVVDGNGDLVVSSTITGRPTSQRAECYELLAAVVNSSTIAADPKYILASIDKVRRDQVIEAKMCKNNNRSIIKKIAYFANRNDATLSWVRGHQDHRNEHKYVLNKAADKEAKIIAATRNAPLLRECWEMADEYAVLWKGDLYEGNIRKKVYTLRIERMIEELSGSRIGEAFSRKDCWEEKVDRRDIMKYNTFIFRMSTDSLPVHSVLERRWPGLFTGINCPMCGRAKETLQHLMNECEGTEGNRIRIREDVLVYLQAATDLSQEAITGRDLNWIPQSTSANNMWYLGKIPRGVGK